MKIDISFIIPMFNSENYIRACIESILNQGFNNNSIEIVVIDDGSTDSSAKIAKEYDIVRYFYQSNSGQAAARNRGIEEAVGEYLCFVDSDDLLVSNSLMECFRYAKKNELDMVTYEMMRCNRPMSVEQSELSTSDIMTGHEYISRYNYNNGPWWYLVKKDIITEIRFVTGRYGEDGMFTMELLMNVQKVSHMNIICYYYICRSGSTTTKREKEHLLKMIDDYLFVYHYMVKLIDTNKSLLSTEAYKRCTERSQTYLFFMMARILRFPFSYRIAQKQIEILRSDRIYPLTTLNRDDYSGCSYPVVTFIINHSWLFYSINFLLSVFRVVR